MAADFTIRVAVPADEASITALLEVSYAALMPQSYGAEVLTAALPLMGRANPALLTSGTYYLATIDDRQVVGCGGWTLQRPGTGETEPHLAHIRHFGTHPDWLGQGIGRAIYDRCERDAMAAGARRFECYASLNAEGFYAALGFLPVRKHDLPMGPAVKLTALLMERAISPA